jgi:ferredoxin
MRDAPADALFYVCGPARLIDAVRVAAEGHGTAGRVRSERFARERRGSDAPITLELRRSGGWVLVRPEQTILEAVEAAGVDAPFSCRNGTCGTCATKVLGGTPEHRDAALSDAERGASVGNSSRYTGPMIATRTPVDQPSISTPTAASSGPRRRHGAGSTTSL